MIKIYWLIVPNFLLVSLFSDSFKRKFSLTRDHNSQHSFMINFLFLGCLSISSCSYIKSFSDHDTSFITDSTSSLPPDLSGSSSSSIQMGSSSLKSKVEYDPKLIEILSEHFDKNVSGIILGYSHGQFVYDIKDVQDAYDKVMEESCKENSSLSSPLCQPSTSIRFNSTDELEKILLDDNFRFNFMALIKSLPCKYSDLFSIILHKFLLKCLLIMRQKYPQETGKDQEKWKKIVESMKLLEPILYGNDFRDSIEILEWKSFSRGEGAHFFRLECLEKWNDDLKIRFEALLDDFYSKDKGSCSSILSKHFNGGKEIILNSEKLSENFKSYTNKDPLLAFLWFNQEYYSWGKCFDSSENLDSYQNTEKEINRFKSSKNRLLTFVFKPFSFLHLESDLQLLMENNHKIEFQFLESSNQSLSRLLGMLEKFGKLTWRNVLNIFEFGTNEEDNKNRRLEFFLIKEIPFFKTGKSSMHIKAMKLLEEYKKEIDEIGAKLNTLKLDTV